MARGRGARSGPDHGEPAARTGRDDVDHREPGSDHDPRRHRMGRQRDEVERRPPRGRPGKPGPERPRAGARRSRRRRPGVHRVHLWHHRPPPEGRDAHARRAPRHARIHRARARSGAGRRDPRVPAAVPAPSHHVLGVDRALDRRVVHTVRSPRRARHRRSAGAPPDPLLLVRPHRALRPGDVRRGTLHVVRFAAPRDGGRGAGPSRAAGAGAGGRHSGGNGVRVHRIGRRGVGRRARRRRAPGLVRPGGPRIPDLGARSTGSRVPDGHRGGGLLRRGQINHRVLAQSRGDDGRDPWGLVPHRRRRSSRRGRSALRTRPAEGPHHQGRVQHLAVRGRARLGGEPGRRGGSRARAA